MLEGQLFPSLSSVPGVGRPRLQDGGIISSIGFSSVKCCSQISFEPALPSDSSGMHGNDVIRIDLQDYS